MKILFLVENRSRDPELRSAWGLSILVEVKGCRILFDVGPSASTLLHNAEKLGVDLGKIDAVFISHLHYDHCGALNELLRLGALPRDIPVFLPEPGGYPNEVVCNSKTPVLGLGWSTGAMNVVTLREHALVIPCNGNAIAVLVGCSHPGLANIVTKALEISSAKHIKLLAGGFHMGSYEAARVAEKIGGLSIEIMIPAHCTSDGAIAVFREKLSGRCRVLDPYVGLSIEV